MSPAPRLHAGLPGILAAAALGAAVLVAGTVPAAAQEPPPASPSPKGKEASLGNSAVRGLTYKAATFLSNAAAYSLAVGSGVEGAALSGVQAGYTYVTYVYSDYLWDVISPRTANPQNAQEVVAESASRTTGKLLVYKVLNLPVALALSYYATGTAVGAVGLFTGLSAMKAGLFYANDIAWDYYDSTRPAPAGGAAR